jgi:hypothetical protein
MCIWRRIMSCFNCCCRKKMSGEIVLGYGIHEISINIPGVPCKVSFDIEDPADGCCVCHGDVNKIGISVCGGGFVIHADIKTNTCLVSWKCEYKD